MEKLSGGISVFSYVDIDKLALRIDEQFYLDKLHIYVIREYPL